MVLFYFIPLLSCPLDKNDPDDFYIVNLTLHIMVFSVDSLLVRSDSFNGSVSKLHVYL